MRRSALGVLAASALLAGTLVACSSDSDDGNQSGGNGDSSRTSSADGSESSGSAGESGSSSKDAVEGSTDPASPTEVTASTQLLTWKQATVARDTFLTDGTWRMKVPDAGTTAQLQRGNPDQQAGPNATRVPAGADRKIVDAFLGGGYAVTVAQDNQEQRPQEVTVTDLESSEQRKITDPPMGSGGPFAYNDGTLLYASTTGPDYCLATYDVATMSGSKGYCAPARHGFSNLSVGPAGSAMMVFDDKRPVSCRTLVKAEDDGTTTPIEGPKKCVGWEAALTDNGAVWSQLPDEQKVETGDFFASADGKFFSLGSGNTSTLVSCGDSTYFAADSGDRGTAKLMRWTPDATLEVVYESKGSGNAFLSPPSCSDGVLTVTSYGEGGDERVFATVPG